MFGLIPLETLRNHSRGFTQRGQRWAVFRSSGRPSTSVACSSSIGVTISTKEGLFFTVSVSAVGSLTVLSRELGGAPTEDVKLRNSCLWRQGVFLGQISLRCPHVASRLFKRFVRTTGTITISASIASRCSHGNSIAHRPHRTYFVLRCFFPSWY